MDWQTPRLLILDCDGVIVDSERIAVRVDAQVLAGLGWPLTEDVEPSAAVVVEDSPSGVEAALAAGMRVFGYAGGIVPADWLAKATLLFTDMRRLPELLADQQSRPDRHTEALPRREAPPR